MDQALEFVWQRTSSQHKVMISSHYRPQTRLLSPDDSKLEGAVLCLLTLGHYEVCKYFR